MDSGNVAFHQIAWFFLLASQRRCNGNTRLVGSQGSTETYPSTTPGRTCITRLLPGPILLGYSDIPLVGGSRLSLLTIIILSHLLLTDAIPRHKPHQTWEKLFR